MPVQFAERKPRVLGDIVGFECVPADSKFVFQKMPHGILIAIDAVPAKNYVLALGTI